MAAEVEVAMAAVGAAAGRRRMPAHARSSARRARRGLANIVRGTADEYPRLTATFNTEDEALTRPNSCSPMIGTARRDSGQPTEEPVGSDLEGQAEHQHRRQVAHV